MTASEKKKARLLVVLLIVAGFVWYFVYRNSTAAPATTAGKSADAAAAAASVTNARIRLDLLDRPTGTGNIGSRNLFQYKEKAPPPRQPDPTPVVAAPPPPPPRVVSTGPPPPPPFKAFKYESWVKEQKTGKLTAYLSDGTTNFPAFPASEGEVLLGQYRVTRLTETSIEIEDLVLNRRQTFPKIEQ